MIKLSNVIKTFSGRNGRPVGALSDINLEIKEGEFVILNGPSGSGKSTLLLTIGGLQRPTSGEAVLENADIYQLDSQERASLRCTKIGFVFQTFNLIPYLSCLENVIFPALLSGKSHDAGLAKARELLIELGLKERLSHRPMELSVGERQRVALCRSLVNNPSVILADEPTGNLDFERTGEVKNIK